MMDLARDFQSLQETKDPLKRRCCQVEFLAFVMCASSYLFYSAGAGKFFRLVY